MALGPQGMKLKQLNKAATGVEVVMYRGYQHETAKRHVAGQSLQRIGFDEENRVVNKAFVDRRTSDTPNDPHWH